MTTKIECPLCHQPKELEISLLDQKNSKELFITKCPDCQGKLLTLIFFGKKNASALALVTDLDPQEIKRFLSLKPLSPDEALNYYQKLYY